MTHNNSPEIDNIYTIVATGNKGIKFLKFHNTSSAFAYYKHYRLNLLTGKKSKFSLDELRQHFSKLNFKQTFNTPIVLHLFYELGHLYLHNLGNIKDDDLLAIELQYCQVTPYVPPKVKGEITLKKLSAPTFDHYENIFNKAYEHLLAGNCYQLNLTLPYQFDLQAPNAENILISKLFKNYANCSAYAHASVIGPLEVMYLSNSPECLFQIKKHSKHFKLWSMPIKGTMPLDSFSQFSKTWEKLTNCKKNEAELFMITDLLRNDLSAIDLPRSRVVKLKAPLIVPGILHQYSLIAVDLGYHINLNDIIKSLFPGGSIMGPPKKKVGNILYELENYTRGLYCGSTIVLYKSILASSINIRSAEVNLKNQTLSYKAGGGITLQSSAQVEFKEMQLKVDSFIDLI